MLSSTRAIIGTYLAAWRYLPDEGDFSFRDWIGQPEKGWLFVTYRDDQVEYLKRIVATVFDLAITETLSLPENPDRELWFVLDEVDTLGKVSALRAGLTKLRKYGGRVVLGLQTVAQVRDIYGKDEAQTLMSNAATKLILRAGDNETADYLSKEIGEHEIEREQKSQNMGVTSSDLIGTKDGQSQGESKSQNILRQALVMPSEIMGLADLSGYLKTPPNKINEGALIYHALPVIADPFIEA